MRTNCNLQRNGLLALRIYSVAEEELEIEKCDRFA